MTSIHRKACTHCLNTYWTKELNSSMEWVWECSNCGERQPVITRRPKGFWMVSAYDSSLFGETKYLTAEGWMTSREARENKLSIYWKRKSKNYNYFLNNPPYGSEVVETYTEI